MTGLRSHSWQIEELSLDLEQPGWVLRSALLLVAQLGHLLCRGGAGGEQAAGPPGGYSWHSPPV